MTRVEIAGELRYAPGMGECRLPGVEIPGDDKAGGYDFDTAERPQNSLQQKNAKAMESGQP